MNKLKGVFISISILLFTACASMNQPSSNLINTVPVIEVGSKKPDHKEYILYIPANTNFPVHFTVNGSLMATTIEQKPITRIKQDLYIYKYWSSFDGRNWQLSHDLINMPIVIGMGPEGGQVHVKVDLKNN